MAAVELGLMPSFKPYRLRATLKVKDFKTRKLHLASIGTQCYARRHPHDPGVVVVQVGSNRFATIGAIEAPTYLEPMT